jgi:hypothetical protein
MKGLLWLAILFLIAWVVFWAVVKVVGAVFWILLGLAVVFFIWHFVSRAGAAART